MKQQNRLNELREFIDKLDSEVLQLLAKRMHYVREIGEIKFQNNIAVVQTERWTKLMQDRLSQARSLNLPEQLTTELFDLIAKHSIAAQIECKHEDKNE